jgi:putative tricarboxylic transport membrane protein
MSASSSSGSLRARPWWLGLAVAAAGGVWVHGALTLPQRAQYAVVGPGLFPLLIGAGLVALGLLLLVQVGRGERFEPQEGEDVDPTAPVSRRAFWTTLAGVAVPLVTMRPLGFAVTAALAFALVARAFGSRRLPVDLALGLAIGLVAWFVFSRLLGVSLPGLLPGFR